MRRFLFLDVDGVLNSRADYGPDGLGETHLRNLKRIVEATGCEVVLTSSWRLADDLMEKIEGAFERHGLRLFSLTPDLYGDRTEEIQDWIRENGPCVAVVIDDDCEGFEQAGLICFQTTLDHGLSQDIAEAVVSAFGQS